MPYYQHFPRLFLGAPSPPRRLPPRVNGERGSGKGESKFRGSAGNCCARGQTSGMQRAAKGDSPAVGEPVFGDVARGGAPGKVGGNVDNTAFNRSSTSAGFWGRAAFPPGRTERGGHEAATPGGAGSEARGPLGCMASSRMTSRDELQRLVFVWRLVRRRGMSSGSS